MKSRKLMWYLIIFLLLGVFALRSNPPTARSIANGPSAEAIAEQTAEQRAQERYNKKRAAEETEALKAALRELKYQGGK